MTAEEQALYDSWTDSDREFFDAMTEEQKRFSMFVCQIDQGPDEYTEDGMIFRRIPGTYDYNGFDEKTGKLLKHVHLDFFP